MADTISINLKATDKGLHILVWDNDDEGDTQCVHDLTISWKRVFLAQIESHQGTFELGGFNIHFGDLGVNGGFQIEEIE